MSAPATAQSAVSRPRRSPRNSLRERSRKRITALSFLVTPLGLLFLGAVSMSGAMGMVSRTIPLYHVFCALGGVIGAVFIATWLFRPRVTLSGQVPHHMTAGEAIEARFIARNVRRWPCFDLALALEDAPKALTGQSALACQQLNPGKQATVSIRLHAHKRGVYGPFVYRAYSAFPANFFRMGSGRLHQNALLVYPAFSPLTGLDISMGRKFQPGGIVLTSNLGESPEYIGNREYRAGDPIRRIDFKAWARIAKPAVREYQEEYFCRVALVLDTFIPGARKPPIEGFVQMEAAISLCASIADVLARGEYIIDLFAAGPELYVFRAGRQTAHFENVMEILACLDPCRDDPFERLTPALADELGNITTLVFVVLDWDERRAALVRAAIERGCAVKTIVVRDGETTVPVHDADCEVAFVSPSQVVSGKVDHL